MSEEQKVKKSTFTVQKYEADNIYVKAVVYGASGAGKTVFGSTAPKPVFASAEGGLLSIRDKKPDFAQIDSLESLRNFYTFLKEGDHEFETVVIDSISEINEIIKMDIEKRTGKEMRLQDWGTLSKEIRSLLRAFRDLPMHVLFIAQESENRDEDKVTKITPALNGKAATDIAYFMDIVGYLFIDKTTGERKIITNPHGKLLTKDRTGRLTVDTPVDFSVWVEQATNLQPP